MPWERISQPRYRRSTINVPYPGDAEQSFTIDIRRTSAQIKATAAQGEIRVNLYADLNSHACKEPPDEQQQLRRLEAAAGKEGGGGD